MRSDGSFASGFSLVIAASSHCVMSPWKMEAIVAADSCSLSTPSTLKMIAIGDT